jgi:hypothetical protein
MGGGRRFFSSENGDNDRGRRASGSNAGGQSAGELVGERKFAAREPPIVSSLASEAKLSEADPDPDPAEKTAAGALPAEAHLLTLIIF